jgi:Tfp pilus assembly protein PilZ
MKDERRKFARLITKENTVLDKEGKKQDACLADISPGGMKIACDNSVEIGSTISGQFKILPNLGPFYVKGEVVWIKPCQEQTSSQSYELGVKFNKVSTIPI